MKLPPCITLIFTIALLLSCVAEESASQESESSADANNNTSQPEEDAVPENSTAFVYGIDISSFQGDEAETLDRNDDSLTFVICRATDGITFQDQDFSSNWETLKTKGFIRGAYHFYESNDDPEAQVDNYVNTVGTLTTDDLQPIVDFEGAGIRSDMSVEAVQENLKSVLKIMETKTGRQPILYTNSFDGNKYLSDPSFAAYTLWIADYSGGESPALPGAWANSEWVLWQRSDDYMISNVKNDFDVFNGDQEAFQRFLNR